MLNEDVLLPLPYFDLDSAIGVFGLDCLSYRRLIKN